MRFLDRRVRIFQAPLLLALSLAAAGCASVLHGTRQKVEIFTDPPGATATAGDQQVTTPGVLKLPRKAKNTTIRIEKEGFTPKTIPLDRRTSGVVWLNFIGIPVGVYGGAYAGASSSNDNGGRACVPKGDRLESELRDRPPVVFEFPVRLQALR